MICDLHFCAPFAPGYCWNCTKSWHTDFFKILIIELVFCSEELYYFSVLWFICSFWLLGLYFGCFCCLNIISIFPCVYVLFHVIQYDFSDFFNVSFVFFNKIFYRPVYKKSLPCIFLFTGMTWRSYYYYYCTSVAESLRHIKISILLSIRGTVISKFIMIFLMYIYAEIQFRAYIFVLNFLQQFLLWIYQAIVLSSAYM
jgi:hypothetical protein